jgi:hypothetical protein
MSLYNLVIDNFKEYDFDTEYCLNIYITDLANKTLAGKAIQYNTTLQNIYT